MSDISFQQLRKQLRQALDALPGNHADSRLVSLTFEFPLEEFPLMPGTDASCLYWARPREQRCLLGCGEVMRLEAQGSDRFEQLQQQFNRLQRQWSRSGDHPPPAPAAFFCYAFDPGEEMSGGWSGLPNSCIIVPRLLLDYADGQCFITFTATAGSLGHENLIDQWMQAFAEIMDGIREPDGGHANRPVERIGAFPDDEQWIRRVERAVADISHGDMNKVVLSRRISVQSQSDFSVAHLMHGLIRRYPDCTLFAARVDTVTLVSATPECIASLRRGELHCDAMAGTLAAGERADPAMVQYEHLPVVHTIEQILSPLCEQLDIPAAPQLLHLHGLQHLWSPIHARVKPGMSLLKLVAALHPTPAVSGAPDHAAREWLVRNDDSRRGWYCGGFGWLSSAGEGHAAVMLRCALLQGNRMELFAGAGITACSDPQREFQETELKLDAILDLL